MKGKDWQRLRIKYWGVVDEILRKSDLILNILDSRFYNETRNKKIEEKIKAYGKKYILVLNKSDLVSMEKLTEAFDELSRKAITIPLSCRERKGKVRLIKAITRSVKKRPMIIGVVGYPNTGKSSVINYLTGRKKARTSSVAGFTRGIQWVKVSKNIKLIDTPGVITDEERDESGLAIKDALTKIDDYEHVASKILDILIRTNKKVLEKRYEIKIKRDALSTLKEIAISKHKLKKGGELDLEGASRLIVNDWQKGKLKL